MRTVSRMRDDSGVSAGGRRTWRGFLIAGLAILVVVGVGALSASMVLGHYHIGRVESIGGNMASISVADLDETFTAEVVDPDLAEGADVVLYVADGESSIVATSPGRVRLIAALKDLL